MADLLAGAQSPVIMAGNGVHLSNAHANLRQLAEVLGAPVASSYKGKSAIPGNPPAVSRDGRRIWSGHRQRNDRGGRRGASCGRKAHTADTVRESPTVFDPRRQKIVQIDIDPRQRRMDVSRRGGPGRRRPRGVGPAHRRTGGKRKRRWHRRGNRTRTVQARKATAGFFEDDALYSDEAPVLPQRLVQILNDVLDTDAVVSLDAGNNRVWMCHYFKTKSPKSFFAPGGLAGMGWAMPAALALKLVYPDRQVVGVTGDGGFMMSIHAIQTAVQHKLPVVYVV